MYDTYPESSWYMLLKNAGKLSRYRSCFIVFAQKYLKTANKKMKIHFVRFNKSMSECLELLYFYNFGHS